ncbi:MAG: hypothetical protein R2854_04525 [Caldilineaceae bacterium]
MQNSWAARSAMTALRRVDNARADAHRSRAARPHAEQIALPLLGATPATDGMSTTLDVTVDVARHVMLLDHALANQNELTPPGMSPLPLVPFAVSMEYMAEVAATLRPGWFVRRLEKLRSYRWLALGAGTLPLRLRGAVHGADARRRHHRGAGVHACGRRTRAGRGGRRADGGHAAGADAGPTGTGGRTENGPVSPLPNSMHAISSTGPAFAPSAPL